MMEAKEHAQKMLALLSDSSKWTQGVAARDARGHHTYTFDTSAVCWCLIGAMWVTSGEIKFPTRQNLPPVYTAIKEAIMRRYANWDELFGEENDEGDRYPSAARFNDGMTYRDVRAVLEDVIAHAA